MHSPGLNCSAWLLETPQLSSKPAPGPQRRRMLGGCRSSLPRSRRMLDGCRSGRPGGPECSTGPLEPALEPQHARKAPLEPTAVRCVRFLRSNWPLEKCCPLCVCYRHQLLLGSTLLRACYARAHTSIYIYIYILSWLSWVHL